MEVLFLRHADAVAGFDCEDAHRSLSSRGRQQAIDVGASQRGWQPSMIWVSPKVRAVQTMELFVRGLQLSTDTEAQINIQVWPPLAYGTTESALACLKEATVARVLVVGHEPLISRMASQTLDESIIGFSTASGRLVKIDGSTAKLIAKVGV